MLINDGKLKFKNLDQPIRLSQGIKPEVSGMVNDRNIKLGFITIGRETEGRKIGYTSIIGKSGEQLSKVARLGANREDEESGVSKLHKENEALRCLVHNMEHMLREQKEYFATLRGRYDQRGPAPDD